MEVLLKLNLPGHMYSIHTVKRSSRNRREIHTDKNIADLLTKAFDVSRVNAAIDVVKVSAVKKYSCLSNAVIFEELARMSAKTTSWNEFSSTMASAIICPANNQKFNFSKYILTSLVKNLEAGVPFYMFPRFIQLFVNHQLGDLSYHKGIFVNPSLTKKVFANIKRVGKGFSGVVTPLFGTMMVQALEEVGALPTDRYTQRIMYLQLQNPLPSGEDRMQLKELMELCTNLSNKVLDLENEVIEMKSSHKANIEELESRVEKLEEETMSLTKELKSFTTRVESSTIKETVVDKEESSKQGRKITDINADAEVNLENMYNLDMTHEETVWISTTGDELNDANEKPVSAAPTNITTAQPSEATKTTVDITTATKAKGIVFHDKEESTTRTASSKSQAKDKGKAKLVEEPEILKTKKLKLHLMKKLQEG
nr:hypothetical protein [Tanacetum cinerariifolium]